MVTIIYLFSQKVIPLPPTMTSEKTSNPIEPFLLLLKDAKGAGAASVITQAMSAPNVYVFGEILDLPNIQEVRFAFCLSFRSSCQKYVLIFQLLFLSVSHICLEIVIKADWFCVLENFVANRQIMVYCYSGIII